MQWIATLTNANTYTVTPETGVCALEVTNDGPDPVYYGSTVYDVSATGETVSGSPIVTLVENSNTGRIRQGMSVGGTGIASGAKVLSVSGNEVTLDANCTANGSDIALSFAFSMTSTNGQPIFSGERKAFTPERYGRFLDRGIRFETASGQTAAVRFHKIMG